MIRHFRDRKTATMFLIIVALATTNLATWWRLRSLEPSVVASQTLNAGVPANAGSTPPTYLPMNFTCQPVVDPNGLITLYGTMGNPNDKDLPNAKFSLYNVQNATWVDSDLAPSLNANGVHEWDLGVLAAQRQFNVTIRLQASSKDLVTAVVAGKSDITPTYLNPIALPLQSERE